VGAGRNLTIAIAWRRCRLPAVCRCPARHACCSCSAVRDRSGCCRVSVFWF